MTPAGKLCALIRPMLCQPVYPAVQVLVDAILAIHPNAAAILFYGSCLRSGNDRGGIIDLYVLVDSYRETYPSAFWALLNKVLPPNVYYIEAPLDERRVRAKYAILSMQDFQDGTSTKWFHSYIWGRFAQPVALAYSRDAAVVDRIVPALAQAVQTFVRRAAPCTRSPFTARDLWFKGLSLSYRAELRSERPEKVTALFASFPAHYAAITQAAIQTLPFPIEVRAATSAQQTYAVSWSMGMRFGARQTWRLRALLGKLLSVLRLIKGAFTFTGGFDYILWKIERHSGVRVEVPARLKRYPLLAVGVLVWRIYRQGGFR